MTPTPGLPENGHTEMSEERVWIRATVEQMFATEDYTSISRLEWDAMTEREQDQFVSEFAETTLNNAGGYGGSVVEESEVPSEYLDDES